MGNETRLPADTDLVFPVVLNSPQNPSTLHALGSTSRARVRKRSMKASLQPQAAKAVQDCTLRLI